MLGSGDGGAFTTAADLHGFWRALFAGQIVSPDTVAEMVRPRHVPDEGMRCGMGFFLHATAPAVLIEGYDAGVSFQSAHLPASATTASVLGNSSEGAWPVSSGSSPMPSTVSARMEVAAQGGEAYPAISPAARAAAHESHPMARSSRGDRTAVEQHPGEAPHQVLAARVRHQEAGAAPLLPVAADHRRAAVRGVEQIGHRCPEHVGRLGFVDDMDG